jgi:hypothetical protein
VDAVRRGYLGLMLFIAALVLMPLLIVDYHRQTGAKADDRESAVPASPSPANAGPVAAIRPTPTVGATASATLGAAPMIVSFQGVVEGQTLHGDVQITLVTVGDVGAVKYTLSGFGSPWLAVSPPYLFAPHPVGWQTSAVADGSYTLTATPLDTRVSARSVHFSVLN